MGLEVGQVTAVLGAKFNPAGFYAFEGAMKKSAANAGTFERNTKRSTGAIDGFASSSGKAGRGMSGLQKGAAYAAGAGVAVLGVALAKSVGKAADFESQLSSLGSVSGATGRQMGQFRQQALKAGADTKYSALEAAQAQTELAKGGLSVKNIMGGGLKAALSLAAAGELSLSDAASYTANAMNLFGIEGSKAGHVADVLATAANSTTADVGDFGIALTQGGGAAKAAGLSFDQTVTYLEALANAGVKGSDAGTSLKASIGQVGMAARQGKGAARDLAQALFDGNGKMLDASSASEVLRKKLGGLTDQQRSAVLKDVAGQDGFRTLLALYDQGPAKLDKLTAAKKRSGVADDVAAKKQDNLKGKIEQLKGSFETAQIIVGSALMPGVEAGVVSLTAAINKMAADGSLQKFGEAMARIFQGIVAAIPVVIGVFNAVDAAGLRTKDLMIGVFTGILRAISTTLKGLALIPGIGSKFKKAAADVDAYANKLDRTRESLRFPMSASIKVVINGDRPAAEKVRKLQRMQVPPKVAIILMRGDLNVKQKIDRIKVLTLAPKIQKILESGSTTAQGKVNALRKLPLPSKLLKLLGSNRDALDKIIAVQAAVNALPKTAKTTLTVDRVTNIIENHRLVKLPSLAPKGNAPKPGGAARGRASGVAEDSLVGEGGGPEYIVDSRTGAAAKTTGPMFMALAPQDYVIPTEQRYRGRALGLMAALAGDLGVSGYAKGKKGKAKGKALGKAVPGALDPYRLPVDQIQTAKDNAKTQADKDTETIRSTGGDIKSASEAAKDTKLVGRGRNKRRVATEPAKDARKKLSGLRRRLAAAKRAQKADQAAFKQRDRELTEAKAYQEKIDAQQGDAELGRLDMDTGNKTGNLGLYNSGKKKRAGALAALKGLLVAARKHVKDPAYSRDLDKQIGQAGLDIATDATDKFDAEKAAEPEMLTAAEQARADQLDAAQALAALTDTTTDDKAVAAEEVGFREAVLGRIQGTGRNDWVATAAQSVKSARDTLKSLTETVTPPDPAELKRNTEEQLASLYQQYGSNFERAAGARYFGAGPNGAAGGGDTIVHQTMNFPRQPDALTWAAMTKFQLEAM